MTVQNKGIIATQATMQYGHSTLITKVLWVHSQTTNRKPIVMPVANIRQNQRANLAPARMATPTAIGKMKAARPMMGFGKPSSRACSVNITDLQEINGFRSQLNTASGFVATWIRSMMRLKAANQPMIPVMIRVQAKRLPGAGRTSVANDVCSLTVSVLHARLVTFH